MLFRSHTDESVDRIKVATIDNTTLTVGKTVKVDVTVWVYSTASDRLDLYYSGDANNPTWTLIGTITPPATGAQTLTGNYVLPGGTLQAV